MSSHSGSPPVADQPPVANQPPAADLPGLALREWDPAAAGIGARQRLPLLFLIADTGGGHRSAARAVGQALERAYPGQFAAAIRDPLRGPSAPPRLRWVTGLYGPSIRLTPWLWGACWRWTDSRHGLWLVQQLLFSPANRVVAEMVASERPALMVSFHGMTIRPAMRARDTHAPWAPVVTVITDLITPHRSWRNGEVDRIVVPTAAIGVNCGRHGIAQERFADLGLPVAAEFSGGPLPERDRLELRRSLGISGRRFVVLVAGGAEGSGEIARRAAAIMRGVPDVDVVALCGRNRVARRRLDRLAARSGGRLMVQGFVDNMADWLRCADVVVTKAGPGMIAEATCCGAPLVLTSQLPGQEQGNAEFVVGAGAGRHAQTPRQLVHQIASLRDDPAALAAMRAASTRLGRPGAAAEIACLLAGLASVPAAISGADLGSPGTATTRSLRPAPP